MKKNKLILKKIRPLFTRIITTADKYTKEDALTDSGLVQANIEGCIKDIQTVVAVGDGVREFKVGDKVSLNFERYAQHKYSKDTMKSSMDEHYNPVVTYAFTYITIEGQACLLLDSRDVEFVIEEFDNEEIIIDDDKIRKETSKLIKPNSSLIV